MALKRDRPPGAPPGHGAKQERRGGIETVSNSRVWAFISLGKQERRGGIETADSRAEGTMRELKQERRGGIETLGSSLQCGSGAPEAGTPWWH